MANDLTDVLRNQLQQAVREFAENLANGSEKEQPSSRFSGMKGAVVGAGLALAAKKGIDAARQNPGLIEGVTSRISAKLEELQGREEEPEDEVEEEPEPEAEGEPDKEPSADAEEDPEAEAEAEPEEESEAKPKPAPRRKPRSTPSRRSAKPKAGSRAKKAASTSTRRSSKSA
jgi:outer membrane biosynthesis protein TonB